MTRRTISPPLSSPHPTHPPNNQANPIPQSKPRSSKPSINTTPTTVKTPLNTTRGRSSSCMPRKHPPSNFRARSSSSSSCSMAKASVLTPFQQHPIKHSHNLSLHPRHKMSKGLSMKCLTRLTQRHSTLTLPLPLIISCKRHQTPLISSLRQTQNHNKPAQTIKA